MRLRNPGTTQAAIDAAGEMMRLLQNARNEANVTGDKRDGFLAWCDNYARPQMRSLFEPTEELLAELDASHDRVLLAPQLSVRHLNSLLNREFTAWDDRLTRLAAELKEQDKIASRPGKPVVLDTSVLMESRPFFTEVRWSDADPSLAAAQVRLIVPILVIEELDDLLHDRNGDRRLKARTATRALRDLHHARPTEPAALPGQPGVTIEVLLDGDWHQGRPNNDAEIIDQALSVLDITAKSTLLATCDTRQLYRAGAVGLQTILMPRSGEA